jgi:F-type H+-transporting ATPase subunit b
MTIDFWGLGLQAINVLVLVWLLSRVFWKPIAAAIATRQSAAKAVTDAAAAQQAKADAALAEVTEARDGIAAERIATLEAAKAEAEATAEVALTEARTKADALLATAKEAAKQDAETAQAANAAKAADLALDIATRLLAGLESPKVQAAFLAQLVDTIIKMPEADRASLVDAPKGIEVVSPGDPGEEKATIEKAVRKALGGAADLRFVTDPALIAGLELRSPHFALHNSWQADLEQVRKAVKDAA